MYPMKGESGNGENITYYGNVYRWETVPSFDPTSMPPPSPFPPQYFHPPQFNCSPDFYPQYYVAQPYGHNAPISCQNAPLPCHDVPLHGQDASLPGQNAPLSTCQSAPLPGHVALSYVPFHVFPPPPIMNYPPPPLQYWNNNLDQCFQAMHLDNGTPPPYQPTRTKLYEKRSPQFQDRPFNQRSPAQFPEGKRFVRRAQYTDNLDQSVHFRSSLPAIRNGESKPVREAEVREDCLVQVCINDSSVDNGKDANDEDEERLMDCEKRTDFESLCEGNLKPKVEHLEEVADKSNNFESDLKSEHLETGDAKVEVGNLDPQIGGVEAKIGDTKSTITRDVKDTPSVPTEVVECANPESKELGSETSKGMEQHIPNGLESKTSNGSELKIPNGSKTFPETKLWCLECDSDNETLLPPKSFSPISSVSKYSGMVDMSKYNPTRFHIPAMGSRFFVIKSYSVEDVQKSIEHEIWCSTRYGNEKLDEAFAHGDVYLFFSVNSSGYFCGCARMLTPVDYNARSTLWGQSKWKGSFGVRWLYVKDVPNAVLRSIYLPNNFQESVTFSRDTQEVLYAEGVEVLTRLHNFPCESTILDGDRYCRILDKGNHNNSQSGPNRYHHQQQSGPFKFHAYHQNTRVYTNSNGGDAGGNWLWNYYACYASQGGGSRGGGVYQPQNRGRGGGRGGHRVGRNFN